MFPAYKKAENSDNIKENEGKTNDGWLTNSSFQLAPPPTQENITRVPSDELLSIPLPSDNQNVSSIAQTNQPIVIQLSSDSSSDSSSVLSDNSQNLCTSGTDSSADFKDFNDKASKKKRYEDEKSIQDCKTSGGASGHKRKRRKDRGSHEIRKQSRSKSKSTERRARSREQQKSSSRRKNRRDSSSSSSREKRRRNDKQEKRKNRGRDMGKRKERSRSRDNSYTISNMGNWKKNYKSKKRRRDSSSSSSATERREYSKTSYKKEVQSKQRSESFEREDSHKKERRQHKKGSSRDKTTSNITNNQQKRDQEPTESFYEDHDRDVNNLLVSTIAYPAAPKCWVRPYILGLPADYKQSKRMKDVRKSRYFYILQIPTKRSKVLGESSESKASLDLEDERSTKTAFYNRTLLEDPTNVKLWMEFIDFQENMRVSRHHLYKDNMDTVHEVQKVDRSTVEKQLSIVEKALESNPDSDELIELRCKFSEIVLPDSAYRDQLTEWANKNPSHLFLWRALLASTQHSLSICRTSAVTKLYSNAMEQLHTLRRSKRSSPEEVTAIEQNILTLLLDLGLFLRQAGLSELLWAVLTVYLELNLAQLDKNKFRITVNVPEKDLSELEDTVLSSEMPMPTLWMRVETLRAGVHWLSLGVEEDCEDPQRMVFPEDVAELVQSINTPFLRMHLVIVALSLLKVPLLPWRDCTYRAAGLADVASNFEGPEALLTAVFRCGTLESRSAAAALVDSVQLASGAQFLATRPGQDQYIEFVSSVFLSCAECLPPREQTMVCIWWLRFCRFLVQLDGWKLFTLPKDRAKKLRSAAKDLLKKEHNRANESLFCEFALLLRELEGVEPACKVLRGAISVLPTHTPVPAISDRGPVCALYRTLVELLIASNEREKAKGILVSLGNGGPPKEETPSSTDIAKALSKFHHVATELFVELEPLNNNSSEDGADLKFHLVFDFFVEWLTCEAWLLFLTESVWKAVSVLEDAISAISSNARMISCRREALWEVYANILGLHCRTTCGSYGILRETVLKGLNEFPTNMTLLGVLSEIETSELGCGLPQWQLSRTICNMKSPLAHALLVFLIRFRVRRRDGSSGLRHMMVLLRRLTRLNPRCPLLWRLYLQLVSAIADEKTLKNVWYLALEACPWVKDLYLDAIQVMPSELGRIQDLLQEKELRLHVTPEELDILRGN